MSTARSSVLSSAPAINFPLLSFAAPRSPERARISVLNRSSVVNAVRSCHALRRLSAGQHARDTLFEPSQLGMVESEMAFNTLIRHSSMVERPAVNR